MCIQKFEALLEVSQKKIYSSSLNKTDIQRTKVILDQKGLRKELG